MDFYYFNNNPELPNVFKKYIVLFRSLYGLLPLLTTTDVITIFHSENFTNSIINWVITQHSTNSKTDINLSLLLPSSIFPIPTHMNKTIEHQSMPTDFEPYFLRNNKILPSPLRINSSFYLSQETDNISHEKANTSFKNSNLVNFGSLPNDLMNTVSHTNNLLNTVSLPTDLVNNQAFLSLLNKNIYTSSYGSTILFLNDIIEKTEFTEKSPKFNKNNRFSLGSNSSLDNNFGIDKPFSAYQTNSKLLYNKIPAITSNRSVSNSENLYNFDKSGSQNSFLSPGHLNTKIKLEQDGEYSNTAKARTKSMRIPAGNRPSTFKPLNGHSSKNKSLENQFSTKGLKMEKNSIYIDTSNINITIKTIDRNVSFSINSTTNGDISDSLKTLDTKFQTPGFNMDKTSSLSSAKNSAFSIYSQASNIINYTMPNKLDNQLSFESHTRHPFLHPENNKSSKLQNNLEFSNKTSVYKSTFTLKNISKDQGASPTSAGKDCNPFYKNLNRDTGDKTKKVFNLRLSLNSGSNVTDQNRNFFSTLIMIPQSLPLLKSIHLQDNLNNHWNSGAKNKAYFRLTTNKHSNDSNDSK
ncbi:hypothetical protein BB561_001896 [Smittium simulii]|uniref:Autophagy-related protein 13 n=1 Tax=Smittium simulii TaxID=133385 RepID=A0A2T9YSQ6_9FUNG|nr:hypothetical protein BB561_001896 [Smittium simulii]